MGEEDDENGEQATARALETLTQSHPLRQKALDIVKKPFFNQFIFGCICLNTLVMMCYFKPQPGRGEEVNLAWRDYDYMPPGMWWSLWSLNALLTLIFVGESAIKLLGLGPALFVKDSFNVFDIVVVVVSLVELSLDMTSFLVDSFGSNIPGLSVLRAFRIFRLLKLVRSVPSLRRILTTLVNSIKSVFYLFTLLLLMMVIFALLGMELFGGFYPRPEFNYTESQMPFVWSKYTITWEQDEPITRYNFDSFGDAFLSIFVVLSGENWNEIYFAQHRATWDESSRYFFATFYFLVLFVVGNLLLFNLFIAILLSNFDDDDEDFDDGDDDIVDEPEPLPEGAQIDTISPPLPNHVRKSMRRQRDDMMELLTYQFGGYRNEREAEEVRKTNKRNTMADDSQKNEDGVVNGTHVIDDRTSFRNKVKPLAALPPPDEPSGDKSLGIFSWSNPIRRGCATLVARPWFDPTVVVLIIASSITLALDWPGYDSDYALAQALEAMDKTFTVLFTTECVLKVISMGLLFSKNKKYPAYLRSGWNVLDLAVVLISLISLIVSNLNILKTLRALRPLRLISRYEDLKQCVDTLMKSIPAMSVLMTVAGLFFIIFGILGMELFGGKFGYCLDPFYGDMAYGGRVVPGINGSTSGNAPPFQSDYEECIKRPKYNLTRHATNGSLLTELGKVDGSLIVFTEFPQWVNPHLGNFDNLLEALLLLFEVSALEGWPDVMHTAMDSDMNELFVVPWRFDQGVDPYGLYDQYDAKHEHMANRFMAAIFFVAWIILGCFVVMNMTIGVVVDTFSKIREENDGCALMTEDQADWVKAQKQIFSMRPLRRAVSPTEPWRIPFFDIVTSNKFDIFVSFNCSLSTEPHPL